MKTSTGRILFGFLLGLAGGVGFSFLTRSLVIAILRSGYNAYYSESGSGLPVLGMAGIGLAAGLLAPLVNRRWLRPLVGAVVWGLGEFIFLCLPFVFKTLFMPWPVIAVSSLLALLGGAVLGLVAAWVDLP